MNRRLASLLAPLMALFPREVPAPPASVVLLPQGFKRPSRKFRGVGKPYVGPTHPPTRKCRACGWWGRR